MDELVQHNVGLLFRVLNKRFSFVPEGYNFPITQDDIEDIMYNSNIRNVISDSLNNIVSTSINRYMDESDIVDGITDDINKAINEYNYSYLTKFCLWNGGHERVFIQSVQKNAYYHIDYPDPNLENMVNQILENYEEGTKIVILIFIVLIVIPDIPLSVYTFNTKTNKIESMN